VSADRCRVCNADNRSEVEGFGLKALEDEQYSWRQAAQDAGLKYHQPLKNHMERHYTAPVDAALGESYEDLLGMSVEELQLALRTAPPELKPLYAVVIHNLRGLKETKPSQQHLTQALKAIFEISGMSLEQEMLLQFGAAAFGKKGLRAGGPKPAGELDDPDIEDAEVVDD
jgi:hypothetical protein